MDSIFIGNHDGDTTKCPKCGAEYYASREFHMCPDKKKPGPKKGEKAANEAIAHEMCCEAKAIMERALQDCHNLGVKVYFELTPSHHEDGDQGCYTELSDSYLDYKADVRKEKARRKLLAQTPNMYD